MRRGARRVDFAIEIIEQRRAQPLAEHVGHVGGHERREHTHQGRRQREQRAGRHREGANNTGSCAVVRERRRSIVGRRFGTDSQDARRAEAPTRGRHLMREPVVPVAVRSVRNVLLRAQERQVGHHGARVEERVVVRTSDPLELRSPAEFGRRKLEECLLQQPLAN
eukprot:2403322-Prymnesium_polylepis.1